MKNTFDTREDVKVEVDEDQGFFREDGNLDGIPDGAQGHPPVTGIPRKKMSKLKLATLLSIPVWIYLMFFADISGGEPYDVEFPQISQGAIIAEEPGLELTKEDIEWIKSVSQLPEVQSAIEAVDKGEEESMTHFIQYAELPTENRPDMDFSNVMYMAYKTDEGETSWYVGADCTVDTAGGGREEWNMNYNSSGALYKNVTVYDKHGRTTCYYSNDGYSLYKCVYKYKKGLINVILHRSSGDD